jgi:hypothetical protein
MCHATGANSEFWLDCLVRTNRMSCIMLKVMEEHKLNSVCFRALQGKIVAVCFVLFSLSSVDVLLCINLLELLIRLLCSSKNLLSR